MEIPQKLIDTPEKVTEFNKGNTIKEYFDFVIALQNSIKGKGISQTPPNQIFKPYRQYFKNILKILEQTPPKEGQMRFGNTAFKDFHSKAKELNKKFVEELTKELNIDKEFCVDLETYLNECYGDPMRIDYGTGHELSYMVFLFCINKLKPFKEEHYEGVVHIIFYDYIFAMRKIQLQYRLEPAGSHGVWGLDDYHFLPFIFGGAELINNDIFKLPSDIHKQDLVQYNKDEYMYINCIAFIKEVKKGVPFGHSSPYLNDISNAASWEKIANGMIKMYRVEVFQKFPVMKHLRFGKIFKFEQLSQF